MEKKNRDKPHEKRRGWLKNGNPPGDFTKAPRCEAKTRKGTPCQCPAMKNGRCKLHGGKSTGPKTPEGIERIRQSHLKHGIYTKDAIAQRRETNLFFKKAEEVLKQIGYGDDNIKLTINKR